ncbi:MAG: hypothetical protein PHV42_01045 [Candidatus Pacebacteria bacterium]|nr:hypothetical protein [Candidatus Paceibacterota bacterium]
MTQDKKTNEILYFYGALVLLAGFVSVGGLLYRNGYRFQGFQLAKAGSLEVAVYEAGSKIFIDNKLQKITSAPEEVIQFNNILPGTHTIAITKDGFSPWEKEVEVTQFNTEKIASFLSPISIALTKITDPSEKAQIALLFPTKTNATTTPERTEGNTTLWADTTSVYLEWKDSADPLPEYFCTSEGECSNGPIAIFHSGTKIINADFYKNREDVFIVAHGNSINTIEIDGSQGTRSYDLYTGTAPTFYKVSEDMLYIKDGKDIFRMEL